MPGIYDVGANFNADAFGDTLADAGVDYATVFAKCNLGFAYYPTEVGTVHPGLQRELLGPMLDALHARGIRAAAYLNTGLDHEAANNHRDWLRMNALGQVAKNDVMGNFFREMCLNTPWQDLHLRMIEEVLTRYEVDGLFLDCLMVAPCYGAECIRGMAAEGLDWRDAAQAREYAWRVMQSFVDKVNALVARVSPGIFVVYNGLPYTVQPRHCELEVLPTGGWGYDVLHWSMRYARTLNKPWFLMTGRFHKSWGDFGGLRPEASLAYDCFNALANGGTVSVGDHPHPRDLLDVGVYERIGAVFAQVRASEPWTDGAVPQTEIAILDPDVLGYPQLSKHSAPVTGTSRLLLELHQQYDVIGTYTDLARYRVVIVPEGVSGEPALLDALRAHAAHGGALVVFSDGAGGDEAFDAEVLGIRRLGVEPFDPIFIEPLAEAAEGLPETLSAVYTRGTAAEVLAGTEVLANAWQPYFNRNSWDGLHENYYCPPDTPTGRPAVVKKTSALYFSPALGSGYLADVVQAHKLIFANCLRMLLPRPLVRGKGLPSYAQLTLTAQEARRIAHVLAYVPEARGPEMQIVEEPITLTGVRLGLRLDEGVFTPARAYLAPSGEELALTIADGYAWAALPEVHGRALVVYE